MPDDLYADIILPLSVDRLYTYRVGSGIEDNIVRGSAVIVPLGKKNSYTGIVFRLHNNKPDLNTVKDIIRLSANEPFLEEEQLLLWQWVSDYYHCSPGEVMNAAIPSSLLATDSKRYFKRKTETQIALVDDSPDNKMNDLLDSMQKTPARQRLLNTYLDMISGDGEIKAVPVSKKRLLEKSDTSASVLDKLTEAGIFRSVEVEVSRFPVSTKRKAAIKELSSSQKKAYEQALLGFSTKGTVLLHGVTSSGKTEIYIHLIEDTLKRGQKVLYLLPEIALTTQIINRLRNNFGKLVGVYHSGLNDNEKAEVYRRVSGASGLEEYSILLGVRSSVFLPVNNLGLVIIDEEHDSSYKQFDPAPRYNARDTAIMRAHISGARVLLGSATPSVESMYNALTGKYGYAHLDRRYGDINMPEIILADSKEAYRKKMMISHFTPELIEAIDQALGKGEQIVLFRNRRGFAHFIICADCGWTPVCPNCSVNYAYHKNTARLYCHYCGSTEQLPDSCASCQSTNISLRGFGTEKVEDEISILFPDAKVERMDYDSTRRRGSVEKIIDDLETGKTDILIGTQMISKGLDIENLTVVGILNIDGMLFYPDFRAYERCFQLASQVSGRAGRRKTRGRVIIQTSDPHHPVMRQIINNDYKGMYENQLAERKEFSYPPFTRLIRIYLKHKDRDTLNSAAGIMAANLRESLPGRVLGPEFPPHSRIQNLYIKTILLKTEKSKSFKYIRELINRNILVLHRQKEYPALRIYSDVDPQ
ncbi:MAG: primosomal protein N' [Bacteroidales bacterium]|nr:primosomal protein N' [Bacteroidales bacterium]